MITDRTLYQFIRQTRLAQIPESLQGILEVLPAATVIYIRQQFTVKLQALLPVAFLGELHHGFPALLGRRRTLSTETSSSEQQHDEWKIQFH